MPKIKWDRNDTWIDRYGETHYLESMKTSHIIHSINLIERTGWRAHYLQRLKFELQLRKAQEHIADLAFKHRKRLTSTRD